MIKLIVDFNLPSKCSKKKKTLNFVRQLLEQQRHRIINFAIHKHRTISRTVTHADW